MNFKRVAIIAIGWVCIVVGIAGMFLPVLQGVLFLLIGLVILSAEYRWAGALLARIHSRFPRISSAIAKARSIVVRLFTHGEQKRRAPSE